MRRLLRISIEGFKTFAARTELELGPGMTAVVGPNGCGKSNLIDAIAWAVGSRSWKSLRGDGMEDVLFHGGEGRPAAGAARVTLAFENEDRLLPIDFSEVTVTRELERGGGGRMRLNGVEARLRDVQALLSGTGLVGGFSLIRQGLVDKLVLSAPEDVGRWIEESANIAAYRARKQEAVDRLRKVEGHAAEAERKSASLRRELGQVRERAARARRRRELDARRALLREALASVERHRLRETLAAVDEEAGRLQRELDDLTIRRRELVLRRQRLEQELLNAEAAAAPSVPGLVDAAELAQRVVRIRVAASVIRSISERLAAEGAAGWPQAAARLDRAATALRGLLGAEPAPVPRRGDGLAELRQGGLQLEEIDADVSERTAALSARSCERARLEERLRAQGEERGEGAPELDPERATFELEEIGRELARIGAVDETAEEREGQILRELEELAPILQDLGATRAQLAGFIRQMEQVTSALFQHTLARVEARFRHYCSLLFQGGDARLETGSAPADPDDPLRSAPPDVEVRVKLPRKPETSLRLLSGGERSLSGLALVLALAAGDREEGKGPGRLLILDEVDAALDEGNAARLAILLRDLEQSQQILCVTHNRLTMHQASRLVGVASGVASASTLVKVDLGRAPAA
jgi:chromosome segregation protein